MAVNSSCGRWHCHDLSLMCLSGKLQVRGEEDVELVPELNLRFVCWSFFLSLTLTLICFCLLLNNSLCPYLKLVYSRSFRSLPVTGLLWPLLFKCLLARMVRKSSREAFRSEKWPWSYVSVKLITLHPDTLSGPCWRTSNLKDLQRSDIAHSYQFKRRFRPPPFSSQLICDWR